MEAIKDRNQIIVSTHDQMRTVVMEAVAEYIQPFLTHLTESISPTFPEKLSKDQAIAYLTENGFPTTTGNLYKMTANNEIPCARIGKRLIFSRNDLANWIEVRSISKTDSIEKTALLISKSANKQLNRKQKAIVQSNKKRV